MLSNLCGRPMLRVKDSSMFSSFSGSLEGGFLLVSVRFCLGALLGGLGPRLLMILPLRGSFRSEEMDLPKIVTVGRKPSNASKASCSFSIAMLAAR